MQVDKQWIIIAVIFLTGVLICTHILVFSNGTQIGYKQSCLQNRENIVRYLNITACKTIIEEYEKTNKQIFLNTTMYQDFP